MSAPGKLAKAGNGFRIDHAFANRVYVRQMSPVCHYDHRTRARVDGKRLTNHSALIVNSSAAAATIEGTRTAEEKYRVERRMTDPGIVAAGENVIYDGEAEANGFKPLKTNCRRGCRSIPGKAATNTVKRRDRAIRLTSIMPAKPIAISSTTARRSRA